LMLRDGKLIFHRDIPAHFLDDIRFYAGFLHFLVPAWAHDITIRWTNEQEHAEDGGASVAATCYSRKDYRWATVTLTNDWLTGEPFVRLEEMVHEFVHIAERESFVYAADLLDQLLTKDSPECKFIKDGLRKQHESLTQDLAHCIALKLWPEVEAALR